MPAIEIALGALSWLAASSALHAQCPDGTPPPCAVARPVRAPTPSPNSIAVLYFDNLSRDTGDAYLADGLTEAITSQLGQHPRLSVKSRYAVRRFRGSDVPEPPVIGRTLGVAYLVTGSVQRAGRQLRVTIELARTTTGVRVWGNQFVRSDDSVFALQDDIAQRVAESVAGRLLPAERRAVAALRVTRNPAAYDHFIRGNYYLAQRTARAVARAIEEYRAAVHLDPSFTRALARSAYAHGLHYEWGWEYPGAPRESLLVRGLAAADSALHRDSSVSDAWMARAYLVGLRDTMTPVGALEPFERAIALDPRNAEAYHQYGFVLGGLGWDSAATENDRRALELEPERPITLMHLGGTRCNQRRYEEGLRWLDSALVVDPGFVLAYLVRAECRLWLGQPRQARSDAEVALRLAAGGAAFALAMVDLHEGDTLSARRRIEPALGELSDSLRLDPYGGARLAAILVALHERERAIAVLERVRPRGWLLWSQVLSPLFDPVRADPRFQRLFEDIRPAGARP